MPLLRALATGDVDWNPELLGAVPTGLIENENGMGAQVQPW
jgi:hypothetical protein